MIDCATQPFIPLPRSFFEVAPDIVAAGLLGKLLVRRIGDTVCIGRIVETEAYLAADDQAAHGFRGKTNRNLALYGEAGRAYVHAMRQYYLLDVVTETTDVPSSVLIRALEPLQGIAHMQAARKTDDIRRLSNGPGKLCQALRIDLHTNFHDMTSTRSALFIAENVSQIEKSAIGQSPRIGISKARDSLLRFFIIDNAYVSAAGPGIIRQTL